jgi:hypothetical protein
VLAAVREAFDASRRIEKEVEPGREIARLGVALHTLEQAVCTQCPSPRLLEGAAAEAAVAGLPRVGPVRLPFSVESTAGGARSGFLVSAVPFSKPQFSVSRSATPVTKAGIEERDVDLAGTSWGAHEPGPKLVRRIARASSGKAGVALGNSRHMEITKALRRFLHAADAEEHFKINFIYKDGSMGGDVHLRQMPEREPPSAAVELNAALESCRHFELDATVDFCLLRNADVARREEATFAAQETIAYTAIRARLDDLCGEEGLHLRLFHTGLEPAVVGFYRAVIDSLLAGHRLKVTPVFFPKGEDEELWF